LSNKNREINIINTPGIIGVFLPNLSTKYPDIEEDVSCYSDVILKKVPIFDGVKPLYLINNGATVNLPPDL
tara:strand:+ start:227 stop:439 length:213 start_codon:yes stop_codon:yes gene_type:complete